MCNPETPAQTPEHAIPRQHANVRTSQVLRATRTRQALAHDNRTRVAEAEVAEVRAEVLATVERLVAHDLAEVEGRVRHLAPGTTHALASMANVRTRACMEDDVVTQSMGRRVFPLFLAESPAAYTRPAT